ncbi:outer membrane lipoprotein chaperone LolA [bacterium]|nr:MAG: outer membrane lipoprotein chaperone LolA [bacterium]
MMKRQESDNRCQVGIDLPTGKAGSYRVSAKKIFLSLLIVLINYFIFDFSFSPPVYASPVDDAIKQLQEKYDGIQDMQGNFSQTSHLKDLERTEKYEGEFLIKKPSSMRWRYSKPRDEEVIVRDVHTWIYKKSEKQVLKTTFSKDSLNQIPIALLNSLGNLKRDFDITQLSEGFLELKPKRTMGYIKGVLLEVSSQKFPLKKFSIIDTYGNQIIIEVKNVKVNSGLEDSLFTFDVPPGVEVFDMNQ